MKKYDDEQQNRTKTSLSLEHDCFARCFVEVLDGNLMPVTVEVFVVLATATEKNKNRRGRENNQNVANN